jgi:hypothetical protein
MVVLSKQLLSMINKSSVRRARFPLATSAIVELLAAPGLSSGGQC